MDTSKQGLLDDRDAIQDIVDRRGLSGAVRLLARVAGSNARYFKVLNGTSKLGDNPTTCAWDTAQTWLHNVAEDISQEMRRMA